MKIGIAAENRPNEKRVIIRPSEINRLASQHDVTVEEGAGLGLGIPDKAYVAAGCEIGTRREIYSCNLVVRLKEPKIEELDMMRAGSIIMSMLHIRCHQDLEETMRRQGLIAIPLEGLRDQFGKRRVEAVEDAGRLGMEYSFTLWGKDPATATVKIMGYGEMSVGAIRCAARKFARVEILNKRNFPEMEKHIPGTDILVDAINRPFRRDVTEEPFFVTRKMLKFFNPGSVIVDLISTPKGHAPVETMRPTYLNDLHYVVDGIYHTACWGWPGLDPDKVSKRYSMQLKPILEDLADNGLEGCDPLTRAAVLDFNT